MPAQDDVRTPIGSDAVFVGKWFLGTRALVMAMAFLGAAFPAPGFRYESFGGVPVPSMLAPLVRWDAAFYFDLAKNGYPGGGAWTVYHAAFFPLYPLLIRAFDTIIHQTAATGLLLSNVFAFGAAMVMCRLDPKSSSTDGRMAAALLLASPGADFLSFPYTESLFCLLTALGLAAILRDRPLSAALFGALASATRLPGVVVCVALVVRAWEWRRSPRQCVALLAASVGSTAGLCGYMAFCRARYGDPLYFMHIQAGWGRHGASLLGPWYAFTSFNADPDYYVVALAAIAGAVWMLKRAPTVLSSTAWFLLLVPLSTGTLKSMIRFQGSNVSLIAGVVPGLGPRSHKVLFALSLVLLAYETFEYSAGHAHN